MSSNTIVENIPGLISNFDNLTGKTHSNLDWKVSFNDSIGTISSNSFVEFPSIFGQSIDCTSGMLIQPAKKPLTLGNKKIYTNPGSIEMELTNDVSILSSFEIDISKFYRSTDYYYRSYDLLEKISTDLLDDAYSNCEDFFGYSNGSIEIGIAILKAPNQLKIRNSKKYLDEIINRGAIGRLTNNLIEPICNESTLSEDDRIITILYKKNGKYYSTSGSEIIPFSENNSEYSFNYCGSGNIKPLTLSKIGSDGRSIKNPNYIPANIQYSTLFGIDNTTNISFYPKKQDNSVENMYSISNTNPCKIISSNKIIGNMQLFSFTVAVNGNTYTTSMITIDNEGVYLKPIIRCIDYSGTPTINISNIAATFSNDSTIDENYSTYITKNLPPIIYQTVGGEIINGEVLLDTIPLLINIDNINRNISSVIYSIKKDGINFDSGTYSTPISISTPGKYEITAYITDNIDLNKDSETVYLSTFVYKKATTPTLSHTTLTLDGVTNYEVSFSFNSPDNIPVFFTVDDEAPDVSLDNYYIANNGDNFKISKTATIKFYAIGPAFTKSDTIVDTLTIVKTTQLSSPIINNSNSATYSDKILLDISTTLGDIYYTTDGTTPDENSSQYIANTYLAPTNNSNSITLKTISIKKGYISSIVSEKTFLFNFICSPWTISGDVDILDGSIVLNNNSVITRISKVSPDYSLAFDILNSAGYGVLEISFDSVIGDSNNYSGQYSNSPNPIISTIYSCEQYSIYSLGYRINRYDTDNYKKYGEIVVASDDKLSVKYELISSDSIMSTIHNNTDYQIELTNKFYCKITISNSNSKIVSEVLPVNISSPDFQRISVNSLYGNNDSHFKVGNLTFKCE